MGATILGQSTCGVIYSCFRCLWKLGDDTLPMWLSDHGFDKEQCHEVELRVGENCRKKCHGRFLKAMGGENRAYAVKQDQIPKHVRESCKSVSKEPLLDCDIDKLIGDPMHISQGVTTHLNDETFKKLNEEHYNDGDFYYDEADDAQKYIEEYLKIETSAEFKKAKQDHDKISRKIKKVMDTLKRAEEDGDEDEDTIQSAKELLEELEYELDAADSISEYELKVCLRTYLFCYRCSHTHKQKR